MICALHQRSDGHQIKMVSLDRGLERDFIPALPIHREFRVVNIKLHRQYMDGLRIDYCWSLTPLCALDTRQV